MKKCRNCGIENEDAMHFCVECGTPLAAAPMVVNIADSGTQRQNEPPPTVMSGMGNTAGRQNFTPNVYNAPARKPRSYGKIFLVLGGLFAVLVLLLMATAAIVFYNLQSKKNTVVVTSNSPTPAPVRSVEKKSPTPAPAVSPKVSTDDEPSPPPTKSDSDASADFEKLWIDYNVTDKNRLGMRIHVKFTLKNMKDIDSNVAIYFQTEDGNNLLTNNREFRSNDGRVAVYRALKPSFDVTDYNDLDLFIPYTEFNLNRGKYNLKMDVDVIYKNGELVQHLTYYDFEYEKP